MSQSLEQKRISEFDWLKVLALILLIFVHSDLYTVYPSYIYPVQWILISCFFFVSGYLAFNSFHKRNESIRAFFKTKFFSLYIPFAVAAIFYFSLEILGAPNPNPLRLLSHVTLLAVFDRLNAGLFTLGFLWFIPYLLVFLVIFCVVEKYVKNVKLQFSVVLIIWFVSILTWVFDAPFKLGLVFSQYFLVFMTGFWVKKFNVYDRYIGPKLVAFVVVLLILFFYDFSYMLNFNNPLNALEDYLYTNARSIFLSLSVIFMVLFLLKGRVSSNRFVDAIARVSILIYLSETFVSYLLRLFVFGDQITIYVTDLPEFIIYQTLRLLILFGLLPLFYMLIKKTAFFGRLNERICKLKNEA